MEQRFELDLRMTEEGIVCNAKALKAMLPEKLKPYNYIVDEENYQKAKTDRAKLNNLVKLLKQSRMDFEEEEIGQWLKAKSELMDLEKMVKAASDSLSDGIKGIDENEKVKKREEVRKSYLIVEQTLPFPIPFEQLYDEAEYGKKTVTVPKILELMDKKISKIRQDVALMYAFLPSDMADAQQVKNLYAETLDIGLARSKANELVLLRQQTEYQKKTVEETPNSVQNVSVEATANVTENTQRFVAEMIAPRAFFDEMNQLVKKYKAKVKVIERD